MKAKLIILSVLGAAALLFGCAKEPVTGYDNSKLKLDNSYVRLDTTGESVSATVKLVASEPWKLYVKTSYEWQDADKKKHTVDTLIVPGDPAVKPHGIKTAIQSWINADPLSGDAGEFTITFSAPGQAQYRTEDVRIVGESGSQAIIKVAQGEDVIKTYTVAEVTKLILDGKAGGSPVLVKGIICKIDEIDTGSYGNATYYLSDDGTYKGSYDAEDPSKNDANWFEVYRGYWIGGEKFKSGDEIAVGDKVTIKATLTLYKGIPETNQNTAEVVEITKSLVSVSPSSFAVAKGDTTVVAKVLYSGENLNFAIDSVGREFLSIVSTEQAGDTTLVNIHVAANTAPLGRSGVVSLSSAKGKDKSLATVTVNQDGAAEVVSVTEAVALAKGTAFLFDKTLVVAKTQKGFVVSDGKNQLYMFDNGANTVAIGDKVSLLATMDAYNGVPEGTNISKFKVNSSNNEFEYPDDPEVINEVGLEQYQATKAVYVQIYGHLSVSNNKYFNISVDGTNYQGSLTQPIAELNAASFNDKDVTVEGYYNGFSGGKYHNVIAVKITEGKPTPPFPITIDGNFADWTDVETLATGTRLAAVKAACDGTNLYMYQKWDNADCHYASWSSYQFLYFDTDNNAETGSTSTSDYRKGTELYWKFFFHFELSNATYNGYNLSECCVWDGSSFVADNASFAGGQVFRGAESADCYECEYSIPLASVGLTAGTKCKIGILGYTHDTSDADKEFRNALFEVQL